MTDRVDGAPRQAHYGADRQPWDDLLDLGWAPEFAAGNVLKYLRRTKEPGHSLASARWYRARLTEMMRGELAPTGWREKDRRFHAARASAALIKLRELLSPEERERLESDG